MPAGPHLSPAGKWAAPVHVPTTLRTYSLLFGLGGTFAHYTRDAALAPRAPTSERCPACLWRPDGRRHLSAACAVTRTHVLSAGPARAAPLALFHLPLCVTHELLRGPRRGAGRARGWSRGPGGRTGGWIARGHAGSRRAEPGGCAHARAGGGAPRQLERCGAGGTRRTRGGRARGQSGDGRTRCPSAAMHRATGQVRARVAEAVAAPQSGSSSHNRLAFVHSCGGCRSCVEPCGQDSRLLVTPLTLCTACSVRTGVKHCGWGN